MQLGASMTALLAGVLLVMTAQVAESVPLAQTEPKFVTLPLKRMERARGLHPQIYLQQHINRSIRRLARMTGRAVPSQDTLVQNLERRVLAIEGPEGLDRRYNRQGVPNRRNNVLEKRYNRVGVPQRAQAKGAASELATNSLRNGRKHAQGQNVQGQNGQGQVQNGQPAQNGTAPAQPNTPPANVTPAGQPTGGDSLGLDIEAQDEGYLASIQMGTPPREFLILMDSGSADLWVGGENCVSSAGGGCGNHNFLGTQSSSSFVDTQEPFSVTYGTGQVSGDIVTDDIVVAGLALKAHTFGVATTESVDFSSDDTPFDGLMGLAQSTLSEQQTNTPVESLAAAGLISEAITSFKISRLADDKNDGEITFGGLDSTKFDPATLTTVPNVNTQGFWEANLDTALVDGTDLGLTGRTTILDTGTTLMVVPPADATTIHNSIPGSQSDGQGGFTVPCTTNASVALQFGGNSFAIDPRDIAFQPVDAANPEGDCISGITSGEVGGADEWLVGDVFLKNAYFSTDVGKNTVTLAKLV